MKVGVIVFPGSNCDADCHHAFGTVMKQDVRYVWHTETNLDDLDLVVLPGGFSYGDYLRPGAMASHSPIIDALRQFANQGKYVLGICNGFQVLTETGLLPGALIANTTTTFICKNVGLWVRNGNTVFTSEYTHGAVVGMPIAHNEGNYYADPNTVAQLKRNKQIVFTYTGNPNGSTDDIAGIINERGNVLGMMPHPERCVESLLGRADGLKLFQSLQYHSRKTYPDESLSHTVSSHA